MSRAVAVNVAAAVAVVVAVSITGCGKKTPPVAKPAPPPPAPSAPAATPTRPPAPPEPVTEPVVVPPEPVRDDAVSSRSLDEINRDSPFQPVFFDLDSAELSGGAQAALNNNVTVLKKYTTWTVTIEGHCDERGTAEYNLALGERRAAAAQAYLVSLGIPASRLRIVSYGREFPFDPGRTEAAYAKNRRAHFVVTAK
jgi:peptidoglycan-associated lipoprotein